MSRRCSYRILPDYNLIVSRYEGEISESEIISLKEAITRDDSFNIRYNTLDDFSDTTFHMTGESNVLVYNWLRDHYSWRRNSAVLTSTPEQVVNITLFTHIQKYELPMKIKIFSTLEAALQWVRLSTEDIPAIRSVLNEIKRMPIAT
ncbi:MAG TPA: STAS/SEC14 domain-containing protein [Bacteroides sp.]|nr:STAS/SEC14 domain-containing protein [Bacteroides sp.]